MRSSLFILFLFLASFLYAQDSVKFKIDSAKTTSKLSNKKTSKHSPKTAAILSAIAPGGGQIYNRKYWKAPIVWGGLAAFGYLWVQENNRYQSALESYLTYLDSEPSNDKPFNGITNSTVIQSYKNLYRNQRDMYMLFGILFYGLNIVDAAVDAHFMNFDVSDDLSMHIQLDMKNYPTRPNVPSLTLSFNLKR